MQNHIPAVPTELSKIQNAEMIRLLNELRGGQAPDPDAPALPGDRLAPGDEGPLEFTVTEARGRIILDFGKPVEIAGFTVDQARDLARHLRQRANAIERAAR